AHKDQVGAQARRLDRRHGRPHPEHPRLIAGGGHHAADIGPAHRYGLAAQVGEVALLDRGKKRIHVDMDDLAQVGPRIGHRGCSRASLACMSGATRSWRTWAMARPPDWV